MASYFNPLSPLPTYLTSKKAFIVWKFFKKEGVDKPIKLPFYVNGNVRRENGTEADLAQLGSYREADDAFRSGNYAGIGFVLHESFGVTAYDFDNCLFEDGGIDLRVFELCGDTYMEYSPSKKGVRAFFEGVLGRNKVDNQKDRTDGNINLEIYTVSGWNTITGFTIQPGLPVAKEDLALFGDVIPNSAHLMKLGPVQIADFKRRGGKPLIAELPVVLSTSIEGEFAEADLSEIRQDLGWNAEIMRTVLFQIPVTGEGEYDRWFKIISACHYESQGLPWGLALVKEWSAQWPQYNRGLERQLEGKWASMNTHRVSGTTQGAHMIAQARHYREINAPVVSVLSRDVWKDRIAAVVAEKEIREVLCAQIKADTTLNEIDREAVAQTLQKRLKKDFEAPIPIKVVRDWLTPAPVAVQAPIMQGERPTITSIVREFSEGWCLIGKAETLFNVDTRQKYSQLAFKTMYQTRMPIDEDGFRGNPYQAAIDRGLIKVVSDVLTNPLAKNADGTVAKFFHLDNGSEYANIFRPGTIQAPANYTQADLAAIERFKRHVMHLCGNRQWLYDYLMFWFAYNIQHPGRKILVTPLIIGFPGAGKSFFQKFLEKMLGLENVGIVVSAELRSQFNGYAMGRCVNIMPEVLISGLSGRDSLELIKPVLTDDIISVVRKGQDAITVPNTTNYLGFSNHPDALPIDADDRRWLVIKSPYATIEEFEEVVGPRKAYFDSLFDGLDNHSPALFKFFSEMVIPDSFDVKAPALMTEEKQDMTDLAVSPGEIVVKKALKTKGIGVAVNVVALKYLNVLMQNIDPADTPKSSALKKILLSLHWKCYSQDFKFRGDCVTVYVSREFSRKLLTFSGNKNAEVRQLLQNSFTLDDDLAEFFD
jgi:Family of unknown function (DUF5906)/Primase C terminal 2 (PriCT-2)